MNKRKKALLTCALALSTICFKSTVFVDNAYALVEEPVAASSSANDCSPSLAFDGITDDTNNAWVTTVNPYSSEWISYAFDQPKVIKSYVIHPRSYYLQEAPRSWTFEGWDGQSWVILDTQTDCTCWPITGKQFYITNTNAYAKYRLNITSANNTSFLSIAEIKLLENSLPVLIENPTISASSYIDSQHNPSLAFDGITDDTNNAWVTTMNPYSPEWISYTFDQPKVIKRYAIHPRSSYPQEAPRSWAFEGWDGQSWVILDTQTEYTYWPSMGNEFNITNTNAYTKYRLNVTSSNDALYNKLSIAEIKLLETGIPVPVENPAVSASNWIDPQHNPSSAFDGITDDPDNAWVTMMTPYSSEWISYTFDQPKVIKRYAIYPRNPYLQGTPRSWTFEGWDGQSWVILDTQTDYTYWPITGNEFNIANTNAYTKYRLNITSANNTSFLSIAEIKLLETGLPVSVENPAVSASSYIDPQHNPSLAFDGITNDTNNAWVTTVSPYNSEWISYSFNRPKFIGSYVIYPKSDSVIEAPNSWILEGWDEHMCMWVRLDTQTDVTSWTSGTGKEFKLDNMELYAKYRVNITSSNDTLYNKLSIAEIKLLEPVASASRSMGQQYTPSLAFDGIADSTDNAWITMVNPNASEWISYAFDQPKIIRRYAIYPRYAHTHEAPSSWTFEGWDGQNWVILDTQANISYWISGSAIEFNVADPKPYTKYRLNITSSNGAQYNYLSIAEIKLLESAAVPVENPAVSASSTLHPSFIPSLAFDGITDDPSNAWISIMNRDPSGWLFYTPEWIAYDFNQPKLINRYVIYPRRGDEPEAPRSWTFEGWDGYNWIVLDTQSDVTFWSPMEFNIANPKVCTKYRLNVTSIANTINMHLAIAEIKLLEPELYAPVQVENPAVSASSAPYPSCTPSLAFDGIVDYPNNAWETVIFPNTSEWISYAFNQTKVIAGYVIYPGDFCGQAPKSWTFEGWDGQNWIVLDTQTDVTSWAGRSGTEFRINNANSYIKYRLNVTSTNNSDNHLSIAEIKLLETAAPIPVENPAASASNWIDPQYNPSLAFDGVADDTNNAWVTMMTPYSSEWISYTLDQPKVIKRYAIHPRSSYPQEAPRSWTFEGWDGQNWVVLDTQTDYTCWPIVGNEFNITNTNAYIKYRLNIASSNDTLYNKLSIAEIELLEIGIPVPVEYPIISSSSCIEPQLTPNLAFDGITDGVNNIWYAVISPNTTEWISYTFEQPKVIGSYVIYPRITCVEQAPKSWTFEGWDGQNWVVLDTQTDVTSWTRGSGKEFKTTNTNSYMKYRLNIVSANNRYNSLTIAEIKLLEPTENQQ